MINFQLYFEKRERNPLRKREYESANINNYNYVQQNKKKLPTEVQSQIRKMKRLGVEPEKIEAFKQKKIGEREKELKAEFFRPKTDKNELVLSLFGIDVYKDSLVTKDILPGHYSHRTLTAIIKKLVTQFKDILPIRKFTIIITDSEKNPATLNKSKTGRKEAAPGSYYNRAIYLDVNHVDNYEVLVHEYAHFVADRIPKQTEPMLQAEYKKMLDEYFAKTTKRKALEGLRNDKHRVAMAKKFGLPTDYAATNFDEWFAEIITYWKSIPTTKESYRFKSAVKSVLTRL